MNWGPVLRHYRFKHNIFQKDLAQKLDISKAQLCKIEQGIHKPEGKFTLNALKLLIPTLENDLLLLEIESENKGDVCGFQKGKCK